MKAERTYLVYKNKTISFIEGPDGELLCNTQELANALDVAEQELRNTVKTNKKQFFCAAKINKAKSQDFVWCEDDVLGISCLANFFDRKAFRAVFFAFIKHSARHRSIAIGRTYEHTKT